MRIPINHFEGNYVCDDRTLAELRADDRVVVRYVENPNGSLDDIAGICNAGRNVVGLMPHPERASDPILGSADGVVLLRSLLAAGAASRLERRTRSATPTSRANGSAIVADTFAPPTRALLARPAAGVRRYVLDLGCGPGTRPRCCGPRSRTRRSPASTRRRRWSTRRARVCRGASFAVADVTRPLRLPADIVYARFLLGHLPDPDAALAHWARSLRPGTGLLVCEEPVRYRSDDPLFARYEETVTAVVAATGATLWAAPALDRTTRRLRTRARPRRRTPGARGARRRDVLAQRRAMAGPNAADGDALLEHFRALEAVGQ